MGLPSIGTPVRASGKDASLWHLEWTFSDGSGAVALDEDQSDDDPRVATPVADGGTGITSLQLPKGDRYRLVGLNLEPATEGTASNYRQVSFVSADSAAGTAEVRFVAANGGALSDPESGSRVRLTLIIDYP